MFIKSIPSDLNTTLDGSTHHKIKFDFVGLSQQNQNFEYALGFIQMK